MKLSLEIVFFSLLGLDCHKKSQVNFDFCMSDKVYSYKGICGSKEASASGALSLVKTSLKSHKSLYKCEHCSRIDRKAQF